MQYYVLSTQTDYASINIINPSRNTPQPAMDVILHIFLIKEYMKLETSLV